MDTYHVLNPKTGKVIISHDLIFKEKLLFIDREIKQSNSEVVNIKDEEVEIEPVEHVITTPMYDHGANSLTLMRNNEDDSSNKSISRSKDADDKKMISPVSKEEVLMNQSTSPQKNQKTTTI